MNYPQTNPGYSATQVNGQYFQQNLPNQVCMVPQLNVSPQMQQLLPAITAQVMLDLQNNAQRSPARTMFFNMASDQWYQNQVFMNLMQLTVDMVEFFMFAQNMQPPQAIAEAVSQAVQISMAAKSLQNIQVMQQYLPSQVIQDFQALVMNGQQLAGQIQNFKMRQNVPPPNMGGHHGMITPGMNAMPGYQQQYGMGGQVQGAPGTGRPSAFTAAAGNQPAQVGNPMLWSGGNTNQPTVVAPTDGNRPGRYDMRGIAEPTPAPQPQIQTSAPQPSGGGKARWGATPRNTGEQSPPAEETVYSQLPGTQIDLTQPVHVSPNAPYTNERPLDLVVTEDGVELSPEYQVRGRPDWVFTPTQEQPYRLAYDQSEYLLTLCRAQDGTVTETLIEWSPEMEYLQHELNPKLAEQEQQRRDAGNPVKKRYSWNAVGALNPSAGKAVSVLPKDTDIATVVPSKEDIPVFTPKAGEVRLVTTVAQGIADADKRLRIEGHAAVTKESVEVYFDLPQMLVLPDDQVLVEMVEALGELPTFDALHDAMLTLQNDLDEESADVLDQRITRIFNSALREGLALGDWSVDSFVGDWIEMRDLLNKTYGEEKVEQLALAAPRLISSAFRALPRDEVDAYVDSLGVYTASEPVDGGEDSEPKDSDEGTALTYPNVVVLASRVSVTTVPQTREEISLELGTGALVTEEYLPQLHQALQAVFKRTDDYPVTYAHRYLMTSDRKYIEIVRGIANPDAILLYDRASVD